MIMRLSGVVGATAMDWVLVETGGIGYRVELPVAGAMKYAIGDKIELWTHQVIREDAHALFGFENREALECFWQLIGVSGVGPKMAQKILASYTPETIARAVEEGNDALLTRISGVGKKTAQKIILDLRGSVLLKPNTPLAPSDTDLVEALESLGYGTADARKMAEKTSVQGTLEERLRAVLRQS